MAAALSKFIPSSRKGTAFFALLVWVLSRALVQQKGTVGTKTLPKPLRIILVTAFGLGSTISSNDDIEKHSLVAVFAAFLNISKNVVFFSAVYRYLIRDTIRNIIIYGPLGFAIRAYKTLLQNTILVSRRFIPKIDSEIKKEIAKAGSSITTSLLKAESSLGDKLSYHDRLPKKGITENDVFNELKSLSIINENDWKSGAVSGAVYHGGEQMSATLNKAMGLFSVSNPLHPELFPGVRKMEAEVISMVRNMYNGDKEVCGNITSGGTESLLMAIKTYRDMAYELKGVTHPEMIVPTTIHAAFDKGAEYFGIQMVQIPINPLTGKVDISAVKRAINSNTILIAGSAPNFPHGIIDDIPELSKLAVKYKIPLHVDCCLGGFIVPFMEKAGYPLDHPVDFRLPGVTSISADTHKYGFAPKGTSVILYRNSDIRKYQYFVVTDWPGGTYASATIAGSRPGALVAGCWTAMMLMGESGYIETTRQIVTCARKLKEGIQNIPELTLIGDPIGSVVAFTTSSPTISALGLADMLTRRHWHLNILQFPPAIHFACTMLTSQAIDKLLKDIQECVNELIKDPQLGQGDVAKIYGTAQSVPDRTVLRDVCQAFLDTLTYIPKDRLT